MRKGIGGQMLDVQDCQGNVTIESHSTTCYYAFKMAIFTAFPEIEEGPVQCPLGVFKRSPTLPSFPLGLRKRPQCLKQRVS